MLTVLSPAKTMNCDGSFPGALVKQPAFSKEVKTLLAQLREYSPKQLMKLMSISASLADLNAERFSTLKSPVPKRGSAPALFAYQGDVYGPIEVEDFSKKELSFAQKHLRILSGLYGVLRPLDLIQPYRLEMKTKLSGKDFSDLYDFWGDKISNELNSDLKKSGDTLVNLASKEYFKAISQDSLNAEVLHVDFKEKKDGKVKIVALFAKKARGAMANFIIRNQINDPKDLKDFNWERYKFRASLSSDSNFVFVR